jgi:hypothetical protein
VKVEDAFASDYREARSAFLGACAEAHAEIHSHRHPLLGPGGEALFLDVARIGDPAAPACLVLGSGTHGVEGFCGSGVQVAQLRSGLARRLPEGVALVLVHAINPWGFAWLRRVNEDNVDVNRNFLDHDAPRPENPGYELLYDALNPKELGEAQVAATLRAIADFQKEHGAAALYTSVSGGQYLHPEGLQYGGRAPVWSNRILRRVWDELLGDAELVVNVDLHSGLGPSGVGLLMQTAREHERGAQLARAWWGDVIRAEPAAGRTSALVTGLLGPALCEQRRDRTTVAVVLEYGTYDTLPVALAMQADNWLHTRGDLASGQAAAIKARLREVFYPDSAEWREKVCARAEDVIGRALAGMAAECAAHEEQAR